VVWWLVQNFRSWGCGFECSLWIFLRSVVAAWVGSGAEQLREGQENQSGYVVRAQSVSVEDEAVVSPDVHIKFF
jgi:hypothetical protein